MIKEIVERPSVAPIAPQPPKDISQFRKATSFTTRIKDEKPLSAFARKARGGEPLPAAAAGPSTPRRKEPAAVKTSDVDEIRRTVAKENAERIAGMTAEERQEEVEELKARFGDGVLEMRRKRIQSKGKGQKLERDVALGGTRSLHADFKDLQVSDKRSSLTRQNNSPIIIEDERTPENIHARYFPTVPVDTPKLDWLRSTPSSSSTSNDKAPRFNLSGIPLSDEDRSNLPTTAGLHHHGDDPDSAGYSLDEILHLSRSTVPGQRVTMLGVLAKVIAYSRNENTDPFLGEIMVTGEVEKRAVEIGLELIESGVKSLSILAAGVNLLWEVLAGNKSHEDSSVGYEPFRHDLWTSDLPSERIIPSLAELTSTKSLPPRAISQILHILRLATRSATVAAETISPYLSLIIRNTVLSQPWPLRTEELPMVEGLRLLRDVTAASRTCAEGIMQDGLPETLLKFLVASTWPASNTYAISIALELACQVLRILADLGRYGLSANLAVSTRPIFDSLGVWVYANIESGIQSYESQSLSTAWFGLLEVWTTCAIDPHRTTPEHDLTWAQVSEMGWSDGVLDVVSILAGEKRWYELAGALSVLAAWVESLTVNAVRAGEEERTALAKRLQVDLLPRLGALGSGKEGHRVLESLLRLHNLLSPAGVLLESSFLRDIRSDLDTDLPSTSFSMGLLNALETAEFDTKQWLSTAFTLLSGPNPFQQGQEQLALDLVDAMLNKPDYSSAFPWLAQSIDAQSHKDGLRILRPLLHHAILPESTHVVSPLTPSHLYLKATTTLRPAIPSTATPGLPLPDDWLFSPLNELLHSADSAALQQASIDWQPAETEVVQATLILVRLELLCHPERLDRPATRSSLIFGLMKVYMLEDGQESGTGETELEIFRDPGVEVSIKAILESLRLPLNKASLASKTASPSAPLESASSSFLGPETPFFSYYQDFLRLYQAISYSQPAFAQLLLPPLAMSYPTDYRRSLWVDNPIVLKSIRTGLEEVPLENPAGVEAFLGKGEDDADVLAGYLRAMMSGWVREVENPLLWSVATWHLGRLFWERGDEEREERGAVRKALLGALIGQGKDDVLKGLLTVNLGSGLDSGETQRRVEVVAKVLNPRAAGRIAKLA